MFLFVYLFQKNNNTRDPRLSKKVCTTDATTLQSVVVVPTVANKKNDEESKDPEKHSLSPAKKRRKINTDDSTSQRDLDKSKDLEDNTKLNNNQNHNKNNNKFQVVENKGHSINNRNNKNKKHASNMGDSVASHVKADKSNKMPVSNFESKAESGTRKRTNVTQNISNQPNKKMNSFNRFPSDKEINTRKENDEFQQQFIMNRKDDALYKNSCR